SKVAAEAVCTWVATQYQIPLTVIRICSTYGPEGGAPADRLENILAGTPIRLHPDRPNNFNPIYEDDYVELGIRAMEVADIPPVVVNWAGSETVSAEEYCTYMGRLVGVDPIF
ncbi:NAD-dependent epimerase/dehydratase family protein, partial [Mycolicibacterium elephantis]